MITCKTVHKVTRAILKDKSLTAHEMINKISGMLDLYDHGFGNYNLSHPWSDQFKEKIMDFNSYHEAVRVSKLMVLSVVD